MRWRLIALVGSAVLALLAIALRPHSHTPVVKAFFTNGLSLRVGAPVRLAGIDIGSVKSVRVRPELKEAPVEVVMALNPPYELKIPSDSTVQLNTAGVLGETYVDVDSRKAFGPLVADNGILTTTPTEQLTPDRIIQELSDVLGSKFCNCDARQNEAGVKTATKPLSKISPYGATKNP